MKRVRIPRKRFDQWIKVLDIVEDYSRRLREELGRVTVILYGSYARGDYNLWSDIDLLVVSEKFRNVRILDRYDLIPQPPPGVEPVLLTPGEFVENLEKNAWLKALRDKSVIVIDDYNLLEELIERKIEPLRIDTLRRIVLRLKTKYST